MKKLPFLVEHTKNMSAYALFILLWFCSDTFHLWSSALFQYYPGKHVINLSASEAILKNMNK